ncbi:hypothetical protein [Desulfofundulus thermobenzoicus]|nr:hypothetical protein [Desulfofundulus thermobenzoicus]
MAGNVFDRSVKALARRYPQPFVKVALGLNQEIRQRERVIRIFPNEKSN